MPTSELSPVQNMAANIPPTPTSAGGGSLKMKFKFNRLSNSKDSPFKITVEAPQLIGKEELAPPPALGKTSLY